MYAFIFSILCLTLAGCDLADVLDSTTPKNCRDDRFIHIGEEKSQVDTTQVCEAGR